ncbi:glycosyltransferase WbuB [Gulosibacter molinativorax]|uniref:D-inositol 3-phosphate glycosyltransferase n=2 Tax=Gulosibacter molinativorax TaxID=256821 RepID=A0ABT7C866_9MICO|nr:glycosyltransferase WbuB [Gulosibacter molinativorax]
MEAFGYELAGDHKKARQALDTIIGRIENEGVDAQRHRLVPHVADIALSIGDQDRVEELLRNVPVDKRGAPWFATASRFALYRGDHDAAVEYASRHPRNTHLAKRMIGERDTFAEFTPEYPAEPSYEAIPGRILHALTNSFPHTRSGYAQRSHSILRSLADRGYEVRAVTRPGYPAYTGVLWSADEDVIDGITYARLTPARLATGLKCRLVQHVEMLADEVRRFRPAVLHTTTHFTNALVVQAVARAFDIPWVYEVRGQLADTWASTRGPKAFESQRYQQFVAREREVTQNADAVVTLGDNMRQQLIDAGVSSEKISVCPNAVGSPFIDVAPTIAEAREHLGIEPDALYVGTVSSIVYYEGLDLLLRAVAKLAPDFPKLRVRIAGDGAELSHLQYMAEGLGIADRCEFPGRVSRAEASWNHAALDVFVVPRKDHRVTRAVTPMKTVEASAVGRPVVAADLPALEELVEDGVTGLLFEAENVDALAQAMRELLTDPDRRVRMGAAGREWALTTRTWASNAETYAGIYDALTESQARRSQE